MSEASKNIAKSIIKRKIRTYLLLILFVLVAAGTFSYLKWNEYIYVKDGIVATASTLNTLDSTIVEEKSDYQLVKDTFNSLRKNIETSIEDVFPSYDDYTNLTRQIDIIESDLASIDDPFEISNITYQDQIAGNNYNILPLRLTIRSSASNFTEFLHHIENSGNLESGVRLMDISSIKLNFEDSSRAGDASIINFNVQINAYFQ